MTALGYLALVAIVIWTLTRFQRDVHAGMNLFVALAVSLPEKLQFTLPAGLPGVTARRILLVIAFIYVSKAGYFASRRDGPRFKLWLWIFAATQVVSLTADAYIGPGIKSLIDYGLEVFGFVILLSAYLEQEPHPERVLLPIITGLAVVGAIAAIQKYGHVKPVDLFVPVGKEFLHASDIQSTYPHRILFGYAMAMGVPPALALGHLEHLDRKLRRRANICALLLFSGTYFSNSRGPWLGLLLGLFGLIVFGGKVLRKRIIWLGVIASLVLIARPGVRETVFNAYTETFVASDSAKAHSYQTRWQLWSVAWDAVRPSPFRILFGMGPASSEAMDLSAFYEDGQGSTADIALLGHTSWDNYYAKELIELGGVGFAIEATLFFTVLLIQLKNWHKADPETKMLRAAVLVSSLMFIYSMNTVDIFGFQLKYLFWSLAVLGCDPRWSLRGESSPDPVDAAGANAPVAVPFSS